MAEAFVNAWITHIDVSLHAIKERGTQFKSEFFLELSRLIGFCRLSTTDYHSQCNGLVERAQWTINAAIIAQKLQLYQ